MLTGITDLATGRTTQFQLDPMGRPLTVASGSHQTEAYRYDSAGNQTFADWPTGPAAPDAAGERALERTMMLAAGRTTYRYDE